MDKIALEKRLLEIDKSLDQARANYNALEGARQECLYWLTLCNANPIKVEQTESVAS